MSNLSYFVTRVERHVIKPSHKLFSVFDELCFKSKNLYNVANYVQRQYFFETGKLYDFNSLNMLVRDKFGTADYRSLSAQTANQVIRTLDQNWRSFIRASIDFSKNLGKYKGKPKIPSYLPKNGRFVCVFTNQQCKLKDGYIHFPKVFNGLKVKTKIEGTFQQLRVVPKSGVIILEVIYLKEVPDFLPDDGHFLSIDLGLDNFATIANSRDTAHPVIVNGKGLKSYNRWFNKKLAHYKSVAKRMNNLDATKRIQRLYAKRDRYIDNFMHQASRFVVNLALKHQIPTIIVGYNEGWKQNSSLSKKVNQQFVQIPYKKFVDMLAYKAQDVGILVYIVDEAYTSGTSFLDNELPTKENYDKGRRISRGLFRSNQGYLINADLNSAYQIAKKVFPGLFLDGIEGVGLHPVRVNVVA